MSREISSCSPLLGSLLSRHESPSEASGTQESLLLLHFCESWGFLHDHTIHAYLTEG